MDKTIDMAREAGLHIPYWGEEEDPKKDPPRWTMVSPLPPLLKAFEALVRADERSVEREACAKVVEQTKWSNWFQADAAAAIRARGISD